MGNKSKYTNIKDIKIYAIFHEHTSKFFIGITSSMDLTSVFSQHYTMRNECTKALFKEYRETIYCPVIFILQKVSCTMAEAISRQVAFIKYFQQAGYSTLNKESLIEWSKDLEDYTKEIYKDIAEKPVKDYLSSKNRILINYGRRRKDEDDNPYMQGKKQVKFICKDEEYEIIQAQAKKHGLTVSAYIRQVAMQGKVLDINYQRIVDYTKEVNQLRQSMNLIIKILVETKKIYDSDLERIMELAKTADSSGRKLLHEFLKHTEKVREQIKEELKKSI